MKHVNYHQYNPERGGASYTLRKSIEAPNRFGVKVLPLHYYLQVNMLTLLKLAVYKILKYDKQGIVIIVESKIDLPHKAE
jgi:hypothetical protein